MSFEGEVLCGIKALLGIERDPNLKMMNNFQTKKAAKYKRELLRFNRCF
jgi:hypothetical protein